MKDAAKHDDLINLNNVLLIITYKKKQLLRQFVVFFVHIKNHMENK